MARRFDREINLHMVWRVKGDVPTLKGDIERHVQQHLRARALDEPLLVCHAIGGTDDHVHMAVTIPPTLTISEWIGRLKGDSSHYINHRIANRKLLEWQEGYGVVSFGTKDLPWVLDYVRTPREHHAKDKAHDRLERLSSTTPEPGQQTSPARRRPPGLGRPRAALESTGSARGPATAFGRHPWLDEQ